MVFSLSCSRLFVYFELICLRGLEYISVTLEKSKLSASINVTFSVVDKNVQLLHVMFSYVPFYCLESQLIESILLIIKTNYFCQSRLLKGRGSLEDTKGLKFAETESRCYMYSLVF